MWKTHAFAKTSQTRRRNAEVRSRRPSRRRALDRAIAPSRARARRDDSPHANARTAQKNAKLISETTAALARAAALDPARRRAANASDASTDAH